MWREGWKDARFLTKTNSASFIQISDSELLNYRIEIISGTQGIGVSTNDATSMNSYQSTYKEIVHLDRIMIQHSEAKVLSISK